MHVSTLGSFSTTKHERLDGTDAAQFGCVSTTAANGDSVSVSCWHPSFYGLRNTTCCYRAKIQPRWVFRGRVHNPRKPNLRRRPRNRIRLEDPTLHKRGYRIRVIHTKAGILQSMRLVYTDRLRDTHRERNGWEPHYLKKQFQRLHRTMQRRNLKEYSINTISVYNFEIFKRDF